MSSTSIHITKEDPTIVSPQTTDRGKAVIPFNEYEDAERNFRPRSLKFWTILLGVYLAVFLVALVSLPTTDKCFTLVLDPER